MSFNKLFASMSTAPAYTPTTVRGGWNDVGYKYDRLMSPDKSAIGAINFYGPWALIGGTTWNHLFLRLIGPQLAAQTLSGTLNLLFAVRVPAGRNVNWRIHGYITSGDTDTPRGTILNQWAEADGTNPLNAAASGLKFQALGAAVNLSSLAINENDRPVLEIGTCIRGSANGWMDYYCQAHGNYAEANVGDAYNTASPTTGYIQFSKTIYLAGETPAQESSFPALTLAI